MISFNGAFDFSVRGRLGLEGIADWLERWWKVSDGVSTGLHRIWKRCVRVPGVVTRA